MKYSAREAVKSRIAGAFGMTSKAAGTACGKLVDDAVDNVGKPVESLCINRVRTASQKKKSPDVIHRKGAGHVRAFRGKHQTIRRVLWISLSITGG